MAAGSGFIVFYRPKWDAGRIEELCVFLDGERSLDLWIDDIIAVPVEAGAHVVSCRMQWFRSPDLTVEVPEGGAVDVRLSIPIWSLLRFLYRGRRCLTAKVISPP